MAASQVPDLAHLQRGLRQVEHIMQDLDYDWCGVTVRLTAPITSPQGHVLLPVGLTGVIQKVRQDVRAPFVVLFDSFTTTPVAPLLEKLEILD